MPRSALSGIAMLLALLGLASGGAAAQQLTVSAASSLNQAFTALAPLFEADHPGARLRFNFAASGALLQQIARGAPVDVLATADQQTMAQAASQGLVAAGQARDFASNSLVVVVPAASMLRPRALAELALPAYQRIAIGLPASVPVGRYTQSVLEAAGHWPAVQAKMIGAQNVRQALDYVARGEVDAGFVYATDAALLPDKVQVALRVPTPQPILYPVAPLAASTQPALARSFADWLLTPPAQAVLARHGFGKP